MQKKILSDLYEILKFQGIKIKFDCNIQTSGFCIIKEVPTLVINKYLPESIKITEIAKIIKINNLDNIYIKPYLRDLIDNSKE